MTRQLDGGFQELSTAALEARIRVLEQRVAALTAAVHELRDRRSDHENTDADGLAGEGHPMNRATP